MEEQGPKFGVVLVQFIQFLMWRLECKCQWFISFAYLVRCPFHRTPSITYIVSPSCWLGSERTQQNRCAHNRTIYTLWQDLPKDCSLCITSVFLNLDKMYPYILLFKLGMLNKNSLSPHACCFCSSLVLRHLIVLLSVGVLILSVHKLFVIAMTDFKWGNWSKTTKQKNPVILQMSFFKK